MKRTLINGGHCTECGVYIGVGDGLCSNCQMDKIHYRLELESNACADLSVEELESIIELGGVKVHMETLETEIDAR